MITDEQIKLLTEVGNYPEIMKICEPQVMQPMQLEEWMVRRSFMAMQIYTATCAKKEKK